VNPNHRPVGDAPSGINASAGSWLGSSSGAYDIGIEPGSGLGLGLGEGSGVSAGDGDGGVGLEVGVGVGDAGAPGGADVHAASPVRVSAVTTTDVPRRDPIRIRRS
jgi:hypothetical protein